VLPEREILGPFRQLASGSSWTPSHVTPWQIRVRISAEFYPTPAVNTSPSIPPSTAAIAPICLVAW
jgi:hypothetical protein